MSDNSQDGMYRRNFVKTAGAGALAALGGCSTQDGGGSTDTTSSDQTSNPSKTEGTEPEENSSTSTDRGTTEQSSRDQIVDGEEAVEEWLGEAGLSWIELQDTNNQLNQPYTSEIPDSFEAYDFQNQVLMGDGQNIDLDMLYVSITEENSSSGNGRYNVVISGVDASEYDTSKSVNENLNSAVYMGQSIFAEDEVNEFLEEDVTGYDDISEEFPDELEQLID